MRLIVCLLAGAALLPGSEELFEAARKGDVAALRAQLDKGIPVDAKWRYDQTALFIAARRGHAEAVKLLIERGADVNAQDSFYKMSVLAGAASDGKTEVVTLLLSAGAKGREQVLQMAAGQGNAALVKAVLDAGGLDAKTLGTALNVAESRNRSEVAELLKKAGAVKPAVPSHPVAPEVMARYAGTYRDSSGNEFEVAIKDGKLTAGQGGRMVPYGAVNDTTFEPEQFPGMWQAVFVVENGIVTGAEYRSQSGVEKFRRVEVGK